MPKFQQKNFHRYVCWCKICPTNTNMYTQVFAYKKCSDGSLTPELHGRLRIIVHSNDRLHPVLFSKKKIMSRWFSPSHTLLPNLPSSLGRWKSAWHHFSRRQPPTGGMIPIRAHKITTPCKIWDPNYHQIKICTHTPMRTKYMSKWPVCLWYHNCVCYIWNTGSWGCILHW